MSPKRASDLTKGIIIDVDNALAGVARPVEDRHSAGVSALILGVRLIGGACVNLARIASAAERIASIKEDESEALECADGPGNGRSVAD